MHAMRTADGLYINGERKYRKDLWGVPRVKMASSNNQEGKTKENNQISGHNPSEKRTVELSLAYFKLIIHLQINLVICFAKI